MMKEKTFLKSVFAALAVVLLSLGFSTLTSKTGYDGNSLPLYASIVVGKDFISYIFILIVSVGYESALWLIYKNSNTRKIKIFVPSIAVLVVALFVVVFLLFNTPWINLAILLGLTSVLARVCVSAIIMSCSLAIFIKEKK